MRTGFRIHWATMLFVLVFILLAPGAASARGAQEPLGVMLLQPAYLSAVDATPLRIEFTGAAQGLMPYTLTIADEAGRVVVPLSGSLALDARGMGVIAIDPRTLAPFALGESVTLALTAGGETVSTEVTLLAERAASEVSAWSIVLPQKPAMLYTTKDATLAYSVVNPKPAAKNGVVKVKFLYQKPNGKWKNATVLQTTAALSPGLNTINITVPSSLSNQVKSLGVSQEKSILIVGGIVRNTEQAVVDYDLAATASATPTSGVEPLDVHFTADATGGKSPYSFNWDFGDGNTSPDQNPLHTYTTAGTFTANVQIVDVLGGVIHKTLTITVHSTLSTTCSASKESGTVPLSVNFTSTPSGGVSPYTYDWNYGDGSQHGTTQNPGHTYTVAGTYTYSVTVTDAINQTANCGGTINVYPVLTVTAAATPPSGTVPLTVSFTSTPVGGKPSYTYDWDFGDSTTHGTAQNPSHEYTAVGTYSYKVTVTDSLGNIAIATGTVTVSEIPTYTLAVSIGTGTTGTPATTATYSQGTVVPYSYTAQSCYGSLQVLLDGSPVLASGDVTMNANHTLAVTATQTTYTLTVSLGAGTTGTPASTATYNCGQSVSYSYSALACYGNLSVLLDGSPVSASGSVTMNSNHTLTVSASILTYNVNFAAGAGGTLTGNTSQTVNCGGSTSAVTAVPNGGYTFVNWTGTGGFVTTTTNPLTVTNVTQNMNITANFSAVPTYTLTVSIGTGATGTPASSGSYAQGTVVNYSYSAQSCYGSLQVLLDGSPVSASGSVTMNGNHTLAVTASILTYTVNFAAGTGGTLTGTTSQNINCGGSTTAVTAVPNGGYTFVNWTGTGGFVTTTTNPLTVTNVTGNYNITANFSAVPTYTLTVSIGTGATGTPASSGSYAQGTVVNYSYSAQSCYGSLQVLLDGSPVSASGSVTMNGNHTIAVSATQSTYTVTASAGPNGSINPSGSVVVNCGNSQNFTFAPNGGYVVENVSVDGSSVGAPSSYNFTNVTANHTISVSFVAVLSVTCTATPTSGVAPLGVAFTSTPTGANPASYAYAWTFGDGGTDTTQNPGHTYNSAGNYTATITVSDGLQTAQCSKSIQVTTPITITSYTANPTSIPNGFTSNLTATISSTTSWTLTIDPSSTGSVILSHSSGTGNTVSEVATGANPGSVRIWLTAGTATAYVDITVTP